MKTPNLPKFVLLSADTLDGIRIIAEGDHVPDLIGSVPYSPDMLPFIEWWCMLPFLSAYTINTVVKRDSVAYNTLVDNYTVRG